MMNESSNNKRFDHLEFYVGNAKQAAHYYSSCFGFKNTAYCGLETGERKVSSFLMEQGDIRFVLSSSFLPEHSISQSIMKHGDTVAIVALEVLDVVKAYNQAVSHGAISYIPPTEQDDEHGVFKFASVHVYGDVLIKFVDRSKYSGVFAPGFVECSTTTSNSVGLKHIDHVVGNVEQGEMDRWCDFFVKALGFDMHMHFDDRAISTEYSALMSKVLRCNNKTFFNINEPAIGKRKSQIQEFLDFHYGPGIQHIGLCTDDIVQTVVQLKKSGVEFLPIPKAYYENLEDWVIETGLPVEKLAELGILVDRDLDGYLLQIFTKPVGDRPTLFFEIIERHGSKGFGAGNFKSLFIALENEQARRGNL
ncbi:4-hydroxyphenylpyruvate dioxygenase [Pseudanabaena sp. CCNP1317]|jgi:4-hydroxyphenylpyruvate dioxygenase|nr:4-hydroxyphenylpyruvate dioxygenase [Pseudanabaena galeata]MEA5489204.1 4-hydroxyphenylpyruvate dioxygenase [Pseudanabaena sp. CCNP1317]WGS73788.1 4-hydroxyphenylpyruvate dioxygenase [Pseudanabaena galeata CCNP1313]